VARERPLVCVNDIRTKSVVILSAAGGCFTGSVIKKQHVIDDNFSRCFLSAVLARPLPRRQPALDVHLAPRLEELAVEHCQLVPGHDAVEICLLLWIARFGLPGAIVARPNVQTLLPLGVCRSSGSRVRVPISCTLLSDLAIVM
jgi:hypothetical protein